jgi:Insertion element 4 transposase N-terminal/Transposase DDE domain
MLLPCRAEGAGAGCGVPGLGVLTGEISPELVDEVVDRAGCREKRVRLLPARAVVYFVLGLCLLSSEDSMGPPGYRSVMRSLTHGVRHLAGLAVPSRSALCRARQRLGSKPFELLFDLLRGPLAQAGAAGAFAFGLRVVAWDGTGIEVPGTPGNAAASGGGGGHGSGPRLRLLALVECGTHALIDAALDGFARASEQVLARRLLHALRPGMLLLADRNFPGYDLWGLAAATGADLLWRVKGNRVFVPLEVLPDGSFISVVATPAENLRHGQARARGRVLPVPPRGHRVRIIEYTVTIRAGGTARTELFRLATTLLDSGQAPAADLAALYHQRWEAENGYAELKTRLRGAGFILRSRIPDLACQEMWAFLALCQAICQMEYQAAGQAGIDPGQLSFTVTIRIARDHARTQLAVTTPQGLARARQHAIADMLADLLPPRRDRQCQRVKKRPGNTYPPKKNDQPRPPGNITYRIQVINRTPRASANTLSQRHWVITGLMPHRTGLSRYRSDAHAAAEAGAY